MKYIMMDFGVVLSGVYLSRTNICGADRKGVNLSDVNFFRIFYDDKTQWSEGFDPFA